MVNYYSKIVPIPQDLILQFSDYKSLIVEAAFQRQPRNESLLRGTLAVGLVAEDGNSGYTEIYSINCSFNGSRNVEHRVNGLARNEKVLTELLEEYIGC